jgi:hypothetical protein|tara:strand:- start:2201 stop:2656 length:456 start_codon:yes stop_codon:yes gene_type:complete
VEGTSEESIMSDINTAIIERLERVVDSLQENSVKMGQLLAVHNEKLDKQDRIDAVLFEKVESLHKDLDKSTTEIKKGCERDIRKVEERLRMMEKKMWTIAGGIGVISVFVSPMGQKLLQGLQNNQSSVILGVERVVNIEPSRQQIHKFSIS